MKVSALLVLLLFCLSANAKIWRVNNNPNVVKDFTTLQAAHDGAASGDTLHVEGSAFGYGGLTCNKKLVIIGPGYFLDQNQNLQAVALSANVGNFTLNAGADGTVIMGLNFNGGAISIFGNNITVQRNFFTDGSPSSAGGVYLYHLSSNSSVAVSNILIMQNFGLLISATYPCTNVLIQNNLLIRHGYEGPAGLCLNMHPNAIATVQNNVFRGGVATYNSAISNNIQTEGTFTGTNNVVQNNIGSGTQFGTANGNKASIDMTTVFVTTGSTSDGKWALKAGSPAIGAGYGSTAQAPVDCGMFGGTAPYKLSGIPPVPSIYFFANQAVGNNNDPIDVQLKVRANN